MTIFARLAHEKDEGRRLFIIADEAQVVKYFYLEIQEPGGGWLRSAKIDGDNLGAYCKEHGFDEVEARFLLEEYLEKKANEDGE